MTGSGAMARSGRMLCTAGSRSASHRGANPTPRPARWASILAAMLGTASDLGALSGTCSTTGQPIDVSAVVSYAGPQDLRDPTLTTSPAYPNLIDFLGCAPADCPTIAALASPQEHVDPSDPPFLFCHGDADTSVPLDQSQNMRAALWAARGPVLTRIPFMAAA